MYNSSHKVNIYIGCIDKLLNDEKLFNDLYTSVSKYRKEKIDSMKLHNDKCLSLGVEYLLKKGCSDLDIDYDNQIVIKEDLKKPYFVNSNFKFNLSHSGNMVMCIISDIEVGCDIEQIRKIDLEIAKRFFNKSEYNLIMNEKEENRTAMFFRLWTLKESYIKCNGTGIVGLKDSSIVIENNIPRVNYESEIFDYKLGEIFISNEYMCSYCISILANDTTYINVSNVEIK